MAGAGYKSWVDGDILTAADVNTYLMQQAVMRFADASARSTAITSPSEGMVTYLVDTDAIQYYDGAAWQPILDQDVIEAKGDLIAGTADDTVARLAVGTNGQFLIADSGETTGLKWADAGKWANYTPSFTNFTLGNGTVTARYCQINGIVFAEGTIQLGSTSVMGTSPAIAHPVGTANSPLNFGHLATYFDAGTATYIGTLQITASGINLATLYTAGTWAESGYINATTPFTWTTSDEIFYSYWYEKA